VKPKVPASPSSQSHGEAKGDNDAEGDSEVVDDAEGDGEGEILSANLCRIFNLSEVDSMICT
jgi:hypothetical protein